MIPKCGWCKQEITTGTAVICDEFVSFGGPNGKKNHELFKQATKESGWTGYFHKEKCIQHKQEVKNKRSEIMDRLKDEYKQKDVPKKKCRKKD
jgi:hypothetical protein